MRKSKAFLLGIVRGLDFLVCHQAAEFSGIVDQFRHPVAAGVGFQCRQDRLTLSPRTGKAYGIFKFGYWNINCGFCYSKRKRKIFQNVSIVGIQPCGNMGTVFQA